VHGLIPYSLLEKATSSGGDSKKFGRCITETHGPIPRYKKKRKGVGGGPIWFLVKNNGEKKGMMKKRDIPEGSPTMNGSRKRGIGHMIVAYGLEFPSMEKTCERIKKGLSSCGHA